MIEESAGEESVKRAREEAGFYRPPQSNQEAEEEGASAAAPGAAAAAKGEARPEDGDVSVTHKPSAT